jgi:hypothetical protein
MTGYSSTRTVLLLLLLLLSGEDGVKAASTIAHT